MERGEAFLLSYELSNSTSGDAAAEVLENHLLSRKMIASKFWLGGGGMRAERGCAVCLLCSAAAALCDGSFMNVLCSTILGKPDLGGWIWA